MPTLPLFINLFKKGLTFNAIMEAGRNIPPQKKGR